MSAHAGRVLKAFGKYHLIASLGQGGMANVYLALMSGPAGFSKLLVIKVLRRDDLLPDSEDAVQMFWSEARLAARLVHPNIVHTYEVGEYQGHYFLAMEYLEGQPYSAVRNRSRGENATWLSEHLRIISEVARGLHYSHHLKGFQGEARGVVHRDVSPHNIYVTYEGQVKLLDFGIAKTQDADHLTQVGVIKGKLDYIAPEQLRGEPVDGRADIFALGAILWEAVAGHRFAGGRKVSDVSKVQARIAGGERRLRALRPDVPLELERIVESAIAVDPEARFPDAASFADAIDALLEATHHKPSAKSLATGMINLFATERDAMQRLIHDQVERAMQGVLEPTENTEEMLRIDLQGPRTNTYTGSDLRNAASTGSRSDLAPLASALPTGAAPPSGQKRKLGLVIGGGAAMVGAALLALATGSSEPAPRSLGTPPPTGAVAPGAPASVPSAVERQVEPASAAPLRTAEAPGSVVLELSVQPQHAQVSVDGVVVTTPFSGEFRRDTALHRLEAYADGYRPIKQFVKFDQDRSIALTLTRSLSAGTPRRSVAPEGARDERERTTRDGLPATDSTPESPAASGGAAPRAPVAGPGVEIDTAKSRLEREDIDLENPYRKRK